MATTIMISNCNLRMNVCPWNILGGDEFLVSNVHLNISSFKLNSHCSAAKPWRQKKIGLRYLTKSQNREYYPYLLPRTWDMLYALMRDIPRVVLLCCNEISSNKHKQTFWSICIIPRLLEIVLMTWQWISQQQMVASKY